MSYLTLKQASEATGLNEATIRRLCKKPASNPFIELKKGKKGIMYLIQANYLFDIYPPVKADQIADYTRVDNASTSLDKEPVQDYTTLLLVKDEIIELLKRETAYLRAENTSLREENRELKLLPAPSLTDDSTQAESKANSSPEPSKRTFWQRLFS